MGFEIGNNCNPGGLPKSSRQALTKVRSAIDRAIKNMKVGKFVGIDALASKLQTELEQSDSPSKVLKDLAPLLPKDVTIEAVTSAMSLTDSELQDLIAERARERRTLEAQVIDSIEDDAQYTDVSDG